MATTDELRQALQQKYGEKPVTVLGSISAVDVSSKTCDLDDDGFMMYGIRLQCVTDAASGILKVPKIGAQALAVKIEDGDGFLLLDCAEYEKIIINGGNNGGLINIESLVEKINGKVVTPMLNGSILPGVTRDSILQVCRDWGYEVEERRISVDELVAAAKDGSLEEVWGTGTAAVVSPVNKLRYEDEVMHIGDGGIGELTQKLYDELTGIQWGKRPDTRGWRVTV